MRKNKRDQRTQDENFHYNATLAKNAPLKKTMSKGSTERSETMDGALGRKKSFLRNWLCCCPEREPENTPTFENPAQLKKKSSSVKRKTHTSSIQPSVNHPKTEILYARNSMMEYSGKVKQSFGQGDLNNTQESTADQEEFDRKKMD